ncbi:MAG TPA: hypothetical protein VGQ36_13315 [Thermoanaerobaculia bacterium]|nr:hypothetical protein [Thermoanaerobaculia bacterium]
MDLVIGDDFVDQTKVSNDQLSHPFIVALRDDASASRKLAQRARSCLSLALQHDCVLR